MSELREAIRARMAIRGHGPLGSEGIADAILALPAVVELREKAKAVDRARAEVATWGDTSREWYYEHRHEADGTTYACGFEDGWDHAEKLMRRALDGEQP